MVKLPNPDDVFSAIDKASAAIDKGLGFIDKVSDRLDKLGFTEEPHSSTPTTPSTIIQDTEKTPEIEPQSRTAGSGVTTEETLPEENPMQDIATACVPCAIGHFAGAAKLLNEAIRFRADGIESNQVLDDIAGAIGELNAMERVDLTPERLQVTPEWERTIADEALRESRKLRHRLEGLSTMEEIEKTAAGTESYYKKLNRQWYKARFRNLGAGKAEAIARRT